MGHHHHKHKNDTDASAFNDVQDQNYSPNQNQLPNNNQNGNQNNAQNQETNPGGNMNMGPFADLFKNVDMNQISSMLSGLNGNGNGNGNAPADMNEADRGTYIINTLKTFLPDERGRVLDDILRIYTLSKTISGQ
jgi:hypothetical protein